MARTILIHLNVEVPEAEVFDVVALAKNIAEEVEGALAVGTSVDHTPLLALGTAAITLAEEV
jgi:hypothetical protein